MYYRATIKSNRVIIRECGSGEINGHARCELMNARNAPDKSEGRSPSGKWLNAPLPCDFAVASPQKRRRYVKSGSNLRCERCLCIQNIECRVKAQNAVQRVLGRAFEYMWLNRKTAERLKRCDICAITFKRSNSRYNSRLKKQ